MNVVQDELEVRLTLIVAQDENPRATDHIEVTTKNGRARLTSVPDRVLETLWLAGLIPVHDKHCCPNGIARRELKRAVTHLELEVTPEIFNSTTNPKGCAVGKTATLWVIGDDLRDTPALSGKIIGVVAPKDPPTQTAPMPPEEESDDALTPSDTVQMVR